MKHLYSASFLFLTALFGMSTQLARAQCPSVAACTPGRASNSQAAAFGMGIFNVTVGSINHTTAGNTDGYQDYSCAQVSTLSAGQSHPVRITTNANANETVRVWIDYNNDGQFAATSELFFASDNARQHTGTSLSIPANAVTGQRLRMRVSADAAISPVPTPCSTPQYSQVEDYSVTLQANTHPPVVAFTATPSTTSCATYGFQDQSTGGATSWRWTFGDGSTSTLQNPTHVYTTPGTYSVRLRACNTFGCDSVQRASAVTIFSSYPVAVACQPATPSYCCNYGITRVEFGGLTRSSLDGRVGYEDFSCTDRVTLQQGQQVPLRITTGLTAQDTWVYLDSNGDGTFTAAELVFQALNRANPQGFVAVPSTARLNQPLRLRVISDAVGGPNGATSPCAARTSGQVEDYAVVVTPVPCPAVVQSGQVEYFHSAAIHAAPDSAGVALLLTRYSPNATIQWQRSRFSNPPVWQAIPGATGPTLYYKRSYQHPDSLYRALVTCGAGTPASTNVVGNFITARSRLHTFVCSGVSSAAIQRVSLTGTTLDNASGCASDLAQEIGYRFYRPSQPSTTATVRRGETYQLNVTASRACRVSVFVGTQGQDLLPVQRVLVPAAGTVHLFLPLDSLRLAASTGALLLRVRTDVQAAYSDVNAPSRDLEIAYGETEDYVLRLEPYACAAPQASGLIAAPSARQCAQDSFALRLLGVSPGSRLQWQASTDSLQWQNVAGQTSRQWTTSISTTTFYRVRVLGCTTTLTTPAVRVQARPLAECYCTIPAPVVPAAAPVISRVRILGTSLDNPSSSPSGGPGQVLYAPTLPSRTAELVRGGTYTVELTVANAGAGPGGMLDAAAWLDLNRNGRYDSTEWVHLVRTPAASATYQVTLPVGVWAQTGPTGLRLRVGNNLALRPSGACQVAVLPGGQGETEEYTVSLISAPCRGAVTAGTVDFQRNTTGMCRSRLRSTSYTPGATLQWQTAIFNQPWADITGATSDEYVALKATQERYRLRVTCGGDTVYSQSVQVNDQTTTTPCGCVIDGPQTNIAANAYVDEVEIVGTPLVNTGTGLNRSYSYPGSTFFVEAVGRWLPQTQGFTATLLRGSSYPLRLVAVGGRSTYTPNGTSVGAWIDWNHNGTFESTEYYGAPANGVGRVAYIATVTVPPTALLGVTLMRVRASRDIDNGQGCAPISRETEIEEYFLTVADQAALNVPVLTATPVLLCRGGTLQLQASGAGSGARYDWLGPQGFTAANTAAPTRAGVTAAQGGTYVAVVTRNGERLLTSVYVPVDTCRTGLATRTALRRSTVSVFPNPTTGRCTVRLPAGLGRPDRVVVRTMTGQLVSTPTPAVQAGVDLVEVSLNLASLAQGLYLLEITTPQGQLYGRVVRE